MENEIDGKTVKERASQLLASLHSAYHLLNTIVHTPQNQFERSTAYRVMSFCTMTAGLIEKTDITSITFSAVQYHNLKEFLFLIEKEAEDVATFINSFSTKGTDVNVASMKVMYDFKKFMEAGI